MPAVMASETDPSSGWKRAIDDLLAANAQQGSPLPSTLYALGAAVAAALGWAPQSGRDEISHIRRGKTPSLRVARAIAEALQVPLESLPPSTRQISDRLAAETAARQQTEARVRHLESRLAEQEVELDRLRRLLGIADEQSQRRDLPPRSSDEGTDPTREGR